MRRILALMVFGLAVGVPAASNAQPYDDRGYPDDGRRPPYQDDRYRPPNADDRYQGDRYQGDRYQDDRYPNDRYPTDRYRPSDGDRGPVATLYEGPGFRGRSVQVYGETSNLAKTGLNDRVGSIRFGRRSGPWEVCKDSKFRGRCLVVRDDVRDTNEIGLGAAISSLRPAR